MRNSTSHKAGVPAVEVFGTALPPILDTNESRFVRIGWIIVLVGVVGSLLWAAFAPLSKGVPLQGTVVVTGSRKQIQHPTGGIIQDILVNDGDQVKAGQVLVRMNSVQARSQEESTRAQYLAELAVKARLIAEATNAKTITFPLELMKPIAAHDQRVEDDVTLQEQLLISRRRSLQASLDALRQASVGYGAQLSSAKDSQVDKRSEQKTLDDQLTGMRALAGEGYMPRAKLQDLEREDARLNGEISTQVGIAGQLSSQIAESRMRQAQQQEDYLKDVRTQLTEVQRDTDALQSRLNGLEFEVANAEVRSPVDGTVVGVNVFTNGGVVGAGAKLMEVVPSGAPLEVEGELPVELVDKVQDGMPVDMMFTAYNQNKTPRIPGTLSFVSADRLVNERTGAPYYRVRVKVAPKGMKLLEHLNVKPGMPVEVFVKSGERSMLSYLLKPIFDRAHSAFSED